MRCPFCQEDKDRVLDSRSSDSGRTIRRRRLCLLCKRRFTTYERAGDSTRLFVIKKNKNRVPYDREKLIYSIQQACYKRPITTEQIQHMADKTEEYLFCHFDKEVPSQAIGEHIMKCLRAIDQIAYIRYASISRHYHNAHEFIDVVLQTIEQAEPMEQLKFF